MDLEKEYNIAAGLPDLAALRADWDRRSGAVRAKLAGLTDVTYGEGARETLDFFPAADPDAPLVVYIHGGYWHMNDKSRYSFLAEGFVHDGSSVAILNYPLCPQVQVAQIADSVCRALMFLHQSAARMRFDGNRVFLVGHSAGAHLAATAVTREPAEFVKGVLAISGVYDLQPLVETSINDSLHLTKDAAKDISPLFMEPRTSGPVVFAVGGLESGEFHRQSRECATVWAGKGVRVAEIDVTPRHHMDILEDLAAPGGPLRQAVSDMVAGR